MHCAALCDMSASVDCAPALQAAWNRVITSSLQSLAVQAARNKVASAACTAALQAARNKIARLEDMDHQLRGELQRVVGQRDDWSARSSRLEKEVGVTLQTSIYFCVILSWACAASD